MDDSNFIKAIQYLQQTIKSQEKRIKELEEENEQLRHPGTKITFNFRRLGEAV